MDEALEALELEMTRLRRAMRATHPVDDRRRVEVLRAELRAAQTAWDVLVFPDAASDTSLPGNGSPTALRSLRERVLDTLTLIGVPAAPKMIRAVHQAFYNGDLPARRLTGLRRDEETSYRATRATRSYVCPALTADQLTPARALLALSSWPLEQRVVAPTSARIDFLTLTVRLCTLAESPADARAEQSVSGVAQLLENLARSVHGTSGLPVGPGALRSAAQAELDATAGPDRAARAAAALRARRLDAVQQFFGRPATSTQDKT